jgi:hypothetical protein
MASFPGAMLGCILTALLLGSPFAAGPSDARLSAPAIIVAQIIESNPSPPTDQNPSPPIEQNPTPLIEQNPSPPVEQNPSPPTEGQSMQPAGQ